MASTDDFLAHYGVKGMKWGVRRRKDTKAARREILRGKNWDQLKDRADKETLLKDLLEKDLYPRRTAARNYVNNLLQEHNTTALAVLGASASIAAGMAFTAFKVSSSFSNISVSAIPLR